MSIVLNHLTNPLDSRLGSQVPSRHLNLVTILHVNRLDNHLINLAVNHLVNLVVIRLVNHLENLVRILVASLVVSLQ